MTNWFDLQLDVLASSPEEINQIERALQGPSDELIAWCGKRIGENPQEIAASFKEALSLKPVCNLGHIHPPVKKARRLKVRVTTTPMTLY